MLKFRKRPVIIEAVQYTEEIARRGWPDQVMSDYPWLDDGFELGQISNTRTVLDGSPCVSIRTLEGVMQVFPGDWIIQGIKGEIYSCKPDIFAATYEPVGQDTP